MKIFNCDSCGSLVFFENVKCLNCNHPLGFLPGPAEIAAWEPGTDGTCRILARGQTDQLYRLCDNSQKYEVCNWMVPANDNNPFCLSCRLNELIPDLSIPDNLPRWQQFEKAKRRILYTIMRLGLPVEGTNDRPSLRFKFVADIQGQPPLLTGHLNGVITLNVAETDDPERERRRVSFHEPYRTLLGHVRHEVAHYYWDRLIANSDWLEGYRKLFGDETADYGAALKKYYEQGAPADWRERYVSAYASAHPWEDWAETWAHYFHIIDTVETAASFGMTLTPRHPAAKAMTANLQNISGTNASFDSLLENWFPLTYALNSLNRGMGLLDAYPFALSGAAIEKLRFIHDVCNLHPPNTLPSA
jgi:hypothetical protein